MSASMRVVGRMVWRIGGIAIWRMRDGVGRWHEVRLFQRVMFEADGFGECRAFIRKMKLVTF